MERLAASLLDHQPIAKDDEEIGRALNQELLSLQRQLCCLHMDMFTNEKLPEPGGSGTVMEALPRCCGPTLTLSPR